MIDIVNLQRKVKIELDEIRDFTLLLRSSVTESDGRSFSIAFVSDRRMKQLNQFFRDKGTTTDVLSFPHEPDEFELSTLNSQLSTAFLGDIVISAEQANRQSVENDLPIDREIKQLILHGLLHLCGYDHETDGGEMNSRELELRDKLGI